MRNQHIIRVRLETPLGERWDAIGGGDSLDTALEFAVQSAPADRRWRVVGWRDLYAD